MNSSDASSLPTLDLLERLGQEMPEVFEQAQVVGKWVWLEFNVAPVKVDGVWCLELSYTGDDPVGVPGHWHGHRVILRKIEPPPSA